MFTLKPQRLPKRGLDNVCDASLETVPLHHTALLPDTGILIRHRHRFIAHLSDTAPLAEESQLSAAQYSGQTL
jgi:hypothetical protein